MRHCAWIALAMLAASCGPREPVSRVPPVQPPSAAPAGAQAYRLVPGQSEIRILAYREGPLAAFGHNHVISTTQVTGSVALASPVGRSAVQLSVAVQSLEVDRPELRAAEGEEFPGELDQAAIDGTRANMLGAKLLDAARFPELRLRSREITGQLPQLRLLMDVELRGQLTAVEIPATVSVAARQLTATGAFRVRQTELGLEPFSVGLGALSVRDELAVKFRLVARAEARPAGN